MAKKVNLKKYPKSRFDINVLDYQNLVRKVFQTFVTKHGEWVKEYERDLLQEGMIGLIKAKNKYIPGRGSFLGLAWLRVYSAIEIEFEKIKDYKYSTLMIEDAFQKSATGERDSLNWEDMFGGSVIDYDLLFTLMPESDNKKLLSGILQFFPYFKLRNILRETDEEHEARLKDLKEELVDLLEIIQPNL